MMKKSFALLGILWGLVVALPVQAALLMPDFTNVPTGWTTDRFDPASFANVGTFAGRDNVLGIGISPAQGYGSRGGGFDNTFYNTQGKQHAISGGAGDVLSASLYIPAAWQSSTGGDSNVRTDEWGVMSDGAGVSDYTIIGFTNYGGAGRLRIWDADTVAGWVDLLVPVIYEAWTDLSIELTGCSYEYRVNGALVYTDTTINGTTDFGATIMQAYNFCGNDPNVPGAVCNQDGGYTAHWANTGDARVPTPASLPLVVLAMFASAGITVRRRRNMAVSPT